MIIEKHETRGSCCRKLERRIDDLNRLVGWANVRCRSRPDEEAMRLGDRIDACLGSAPAVGRMIHEPDPELCERFVGHSP